MKKKTFKAELLSGHQEDAVEVPFDPTATWGVAPAKLWRGRKGHRVLATINGVPFETFIVPRQQKSFLLVDDDIKDEGGFAVGDVVSVSVAPVNRAKD
jgi:hypothetical protein